MFTANSRDSQLSFAFLLLGETVLAALFFDGVEKYLLALTWLSLILWAVYLLSKKQTVMVYIDPAVAALIAFVAWMLVSLLWHPATYYGVMLNWQLGIFPFVMLVTAYLLRKDDIQPSVNILFLLGIIVAAFSIYQSLILDEHATGLFYNKNNNASYLNLTLLPIISLLIFKDDKGYWRWLASAACVLLFFAVLQATSRAALIALLICALALIFVALKMGKWKAVLWVLLLGLFTLLLNSVPSGGEISTDLESSRIRWYIFSSTLEMIGDAGLLGAGNGMWSHIYPQYRSIHDTSAGYYVHNDYLQIAYELGIVGILFLILFLLFFSYKSFQLLKQENNVNYFAIYTGLFAAVTAIAVHSLATFNFYHAGILAVIGFYCGLILKRAAEMKLVSGYSFTFEVTEARIILVILAMLILGHSVLLPGYADAMSRGILGTKLSRLEPEERYHAFMRLSAFDPGSSYYRAEAAMSLAESGQGKSMSEREDIFRQSSALLHEVVQQNRFAKGIYHTEARLLSSYRDVVGNSWREQAITLATKELALDPAEVAARLFLARLVAEGGDKERALEILLVRHDHPSNKRMSYYQYGKKLAAELGRGDVERRFSDLIDEYPKDWAQF